MLFRRGRIAPGLEWGVRETLTTYLANLPDGVIRAEEPATFVRRQYPPRFHFPVQLLSDDEVRFSGGIHMTAHGGLLRVWARMPALHFHGDHVDLSVEDAEGCRLLIGAADGEPLTTAGGSATPRLTEEGAAWLGGSYLAGDRLSRLIFRPTQKPISMI